MSCKISRKIIKQLVETIVIINRHLTDSGHYSQQKYDAIRMT